MLALLPHGTTLTRGKLREALAVQNQRLGHILDSLEKTGRIRRTSGGWQRVF